MPEKNNLSGEEAQLALKESLESAKKLVARAKQLIAESEKVRLLSSQHRVPLPRLGRDDSKFPAPFGFSTDQFFVHRSVVASMPLIAMGQWSSDASTATRIASEECFAPILRRRLAR